MGDAADDLFDSMFRNFALFDERPARRPATRVTCRNCGESDLRWGNVKGGGWRVKNKDGSLHVCSSAVERFYGQG